MSTPSGAKVISTIILIIDVGRVCRLCSSHRLPDLAEIINVLNITAVIDSCHVSQQYALASIPNVQTVNV